MLLNFYQTAQRHCVFSLALLKHLTAPVTSLTTTYQISFQCSSVEERERRIMHKNIESKILIGRYCLECLDFYCRIILKVQVTGIVLRMWSRNTAVSD